MLALSVEVLNRFYVFVFFSNFFSNKKNNYSIWMKNVIKKNTNIIKSNERRKKTEINENET